MVRFFKGLHILSQGTFEDDFPFPKVQYVTRWAPEPVTNVVTSYNLYKWPKINE